MTNLVTMLPVVRAMWNWAHARLDEIHVASARPALAPAVILGRGAMALPLLALLAVPAAAREPLTRYKVPDAYDFSNVLAGRLVDVQLLVEGQSAPLYVAPGRNDGRRYVEAFAGQRYSIQLRNNTGRRIGVLLAVDGLNVVNGEKSRLSRGEPMYVLDPWESAEIRGWRTSLADIRRFVFVDEQRSYATRTGQANGDMGWIRVLTFNEDIPWWQVPKRVDVPFEERSLDKGQARDEMAPEAQAPLARRQAESNGSQGQAYEGGGSYPGTGWGERSHDPVQQTNFRPAASATDRLVVRYEYGSGLRALGIEPWRGRDRLEERDRGQLGFAKPPRW